VYFHNDITFRKLSSETLGQLVALKEDSWLTTHQVSIMNDDDELVWFRNLDTNVHSPRNLVLEAHFSRQDTTFGIFKIFGIDYINRTADVAWDVFKQFRGRGLGKKIVAGGVAFCFDVLALHRLNTEILVVNTPSLKCAATAGFVPEGVKRQAVHKLGDFIDSIVLGIIVHEWTGQGVGKPTEI